LLEHLHLLFRLRSLPKVPVITGLDGEEPLPVAQVVTSDKSFFAVFGDEQSAAFLWLLCSIAWMKNNIALKFERIIYLTLFSCTSMGILMIQVDVQSGKILSVLAER